MVRQTYSSGARCVNFPAVDLQKSSMSNQRDRKRIAIIPGDGIGQDVIPQAVKVIQATGAAIEFGAFGDPRVPTNIHAKEILLGMRFKMDLYANVRPVRLLDGTLCPLKGVEPN